MGAVRAEKREEAAETLWNARRMSVMGVEAARAVKGSCWRDVLGVVVVVADRRLCLRVVEAEAFVCDVVVAVVRLRFC